MSHSPTVLISDDEPLVVSALARLARRAGLSFISDTSSERVMDLARDQQPALILLDVNQPVDGRDLLAALKRDPQTRHIKVLMLSGREDTYLRQQCLELGAEDFVLKPFDPTFIARIARLCGIAAGDATSGWTAPIRSNDVTGKIVIRLGAGERAPNSSDGYLSAAIAAA